jgi:purine nucleoside phosphorylase
MLVKIKETADFIRTKITCTPQIGIILGSGLGNLGENIENPEYIPYGEIPNFPVSTVKGHKGRLIIGEFGGYDLKLIDMMNEIANDNNIKVHNGVYVGVSGPCFETPAEYRAFRILGGDTVGMSTVPEVITARHAGIPCFACSVITDFSGKSIM